MTLYFVAFRAFKDNWVRYIFVAFRALKYNWVRFVETTTTIENSPKHLKYLLD